MRHRDTAPSDADLVLRRAIELDADHTSGDDIELDQTTLSEIAAEIGVAPEAVVTAIAEARTGVLAHRSLVDRVIGPRRVWAHRPITYDDELARARLLDWLEVTHGLRPRVRPDGVVVASKRRDLVGKVGIGLRKAQGVGGLAVATTVRATTVVPDDDDAGSDGAICLVADVGAKRKEAVLGGSAVAMGASVVVGLAAVITGPLTLVGVPAAAGVGTLVARRVHRSTVARVSESVELTVDGVAVGEDAPKPKGSLVRRRRTERVLERSDRERPELPAPERADD